MSIATNLSEAMWRKLGGTAISRVAGNCQSTVPVFCNRGDFANLHNAKEEEGRDFTSPYLGFCNRQTSTLAIRIKNTYAPQVSRVFFEKTLLPDNARFTKPEYSLEQLGIHIQIDCQPIALQTSLAGDSESRIFSSNANLRFILFVQRGTALAYIVKLGIVKCVFDDVNHIPDFNGFKCATIFCGGYAVALRCACQYAYQR